MKTAGGERRRNRHTPHRWPKKAVIETWLIREPGEQGERERDRTIWQIFMQVSSPAWHREGELHWTKATISRSAS